MRNSEHLEIALEQTVFTRRAVLHYIYVVELDFLSVNGNRKVILVHFRPRFFRERNSHRILLAVRHERPFAETRKDLIYIILGIVNPGCRVFSASASDLPFRGVTAINHCDSVILSHICLVYF